MKRLLLALLINLFIVLLLPTKALAQEAKMGMHVLFIEDVPKAVELLRSQDPTNSQWYYITIPYSLEDVEKKDQWQAFFKDAKQQRVIPIVRLVTKADGATWAVPTRKNVTDQLNALAQLEWPTTARRVIIFNEVNHKKEWGGNVDPAGYTRIFRFASLWARSLQKNFIILPAAMDLAAPTGPTTWDAFAYLRAMHGEDPEIFSYADAWNSHSYPNPAFSAPPTATGKNSLLGYQHELAFLKEKNVRDLPVYITETGWELNRKTERNLASYYKYALEKIWLPDSRVVAVTPFVLNGDPGPFSGFSFMSAAGKPTTHYVALEKVLGVQAAN